MGVAYLSCRACSTHSSRLLQQEDLVFICLKGSNNGGEEPDAHCPRSLEPNILPIFGLKLLTIFAKCSGLLQIVSELWPPLLSETPGCSQGIEMYSKCSIVWLNRFCKFPSKMYASMSKRPGSETSFLTRCTSTYMLLYCIH